MEAASTEIANSNKIQNEVSAESAASLVVTSRLEHDDRRHTTRTWRCDCTPLESFITFFRSACALLLVIVWQAASGGVGSTSLALP